MYANAVEKWDCRQKSSREMYLRYADVNMTIAAGFLCKEGVLLCADTEHTAWAMKLQGAKLGCFGFPGGKLAYVYAGNTRFAFSAIQKCKSRLEACTDDLLGEIESVLDNEYRRNVLDHPNEATDGALAYSFLLAFWDGSKTRLFVTSQTAMQELDGYECLGGGDSLAHYVLRPSYAVGIPYRRALVIAAHALAAVKDYVPGCGGMSIFKFLRHDGAEGLLTSSHKGICENIEKYWKAHEFTSREVLLALANEEITEEHFGRYLTNMIVPRFLQVKRRWDAERADREQAFRNVNTDPSFSEEQLLKAFEQLSMGFAPIP